MADRRMSDVGGTPGGLGEFFMGFIMACVGGYLVSNQVTVAGAYWNFYGGNTFGITLLPMLFGVGILFWEGKSAIGWGVTAGGGPVILGGGGAQQPHPFFPSKPVSHTRTPVL